MSAGPLGLCRRSSDEYVARHAPPRDADGTASVMSGAATPSFAFPETVLVREVSGELVLLDLAHENYYGLDRIGADIVTRLTKLPHDDALAELCRDYEVAPEV